MTGFTKPILFACVSLIGAHFCSPAVAQGIAGDYRQIAACVFKKLDPMSPGNFRIATLPSEIIVTFETTGGGMTFRDLKATFTSGGPGLTAIDIEGRPPGFYPSKVRPLAEECSSTLQAPPIKQRR